MRKLLERYKGRLCFTGLTLKRTKEGSDGEGDATIKLALALTEDGNVGEASTDASGEFLTRVSVHKRTSASIFNKMDGYADSFFLWAISLLMGFVEKRRECCTHVEWDLGTCEDNKLGKAGKACGVKESVAHKAQDAKRKVTKQKAHNVKETMRHKVYESKEMAKDRVREKAHQLKEKQVELSPKKISEYEIIEIFDNVCNLKKEEADWMLKIDVVEKGNKLLLIEQEEEGICNSEYKTIKSPMIDWEMRDLTKDFELKGDIVGVSSKMSS